MGILVEHTIKLTCITSEVPGKLPNDLFKKVDDLQREMWDLTKVEHTPISNGFRSVYTLEKVYEE